MSGRPGSVVDARPHDTATYENARPHDTATHDHARHTATHDHPWEEGVRP
jgi:hypothetical protein